jgi:hypothetical protein
LQRIAALLGFEDKTAALVEIDASGAGGAVGVGERDGALEGVGVERVVGLRGLGALDGEEVAEFREEKLVVGTLGGAGFTPTRNEFPRRVVACGLVACRAGCVAHKSP